MIVVYGFAGNIVRFSALTCKLITGFTSISNSTIHWLQEIDKGG